MQIGFKKEALSMNERAPFVGARRLELPTLPTLMSGYASQLHHF